MSVGEGQERHDARGVQEMEIRYREIPSIKISCASCFTQKTKMRMHLDYTFEVRSNQAFLTKPCGMAQTHHTMLRTRAVP